MSRNIGRAWGFGLVLDGKGGHMYGEWKGVRDE